MLSHQMSPSSVMAQFVKIEFLAAVSMALRFDCSFVPGATPKKAYSGLMAYSRPSAPNFIQAMSSPTVSTFHPGLVGISIARLVLPQAEGNATSLYLAYPAALVSSVTSMCAPLHTSL